MEPSGTPMGEGFQEKFPSFSVISSVIDSYVKQVTSDRCAYIKNEMGKNQKRLVQYKMHLFKLAQSGRAYTCTNTDIGVLTKRQNDAIAVLGGTVESVRENATTLQDYVYRPGVITNVGSRIFVEDAVQSIKLIKVERLPPYISWTFLDRNQKTRADKPGGWRRLYYDKAWGETLVVSDSDEEVLKYDEETDEFGGLEDFILRAIEEMGQSDAVLDVLAQRLSREPCEIKARYEVLSNRENAVASSQIERREAISSLLCDKDLDTALHSFNKLFCRRCFVFNCGLHGCPEELIFPAEKQLPWSCSDEGNIPCGLHCYRQLSKNKSLLQSSSRGNSEQIETATSNERYVLEISNPECRSNLDLTASHPSASPAVSPLVENFGIFERNSNQLSEHGLVSTTNRKKKLISSISDSPPRPSISWKAMEKTLFKKGVEIFGRNSCLIARNVMQYTRTCSDVFEFMNHSENSLFSEEGNRLASLSDDCSMGDEPDGNENMHTKVKKRSNFSRRKGGARRLKYTSKSTRYRSKKRIPEGQDTSHYSPCGCQSVCGDHCVCLLNKTRCEKYCGCPTSCKNRFRGCHCFKSQCRSPQCPCYAARRECDPDVCQNCWISFGDGTLGFPCQKGDTYECQNMKLLLRQQQKVLLGRSDVSGWGIFLKDGVDKNEYIGEYTGEIISHREADKRGKIYDRVNYSYLFNLNNRYVIDAYHQGSKLKFANHSYDPNCQAKILRVGGDHRVGIYASKRISAGEEILYDYGYDDYNAPDWMKELMASASGSKKQKDTPSSRRKNA